MTIDTMYRAAPILPPAPTPRASQLGPFDFLRTLRRNPIETWTEAHFERPILSGRGLLGIGAVVSEPRAIRRVLLDNAANYRKDALQKRVLAPGLSNGLLTAEDDAWRMQRRALAPLFTPRIVTGFAGAMARNAEALASRWSHLRPGRVIDVQQHMARVTLDILGETIFSDGLERDPDEFMAAMSHFFATIGTLDLFDLLDFPDWVPRLAQLRSRSSISFFEAAVDAIIDRRKALIARDEPAPDDLLTLLLRAQDPQTGTGLSDTEVKANIVTFIAAGHETTANALTWALFLLSLSPEWSARLCVEAEQELDGPVTGLAERLVETRAVIEEAMRLYPPVASLSREAIGPDDLCGRRIRKGALVVISPYVLHRHALLWNRPNHFDPSRFLPGARETIDRYAYLPFGAGPRICIGAAFSIQEAVIVLATLMRRFDVRPVPGHIVEPIQRITLRPRGGMPLILQPRNGMA
ncbi:cytochrome P450 [Beijerinckia sp. L45]|uniref:cytochrome P450 n=1 Tax=Beijerinckia sp. L45 TaxID=1641855 RepID=UPI0015772928|nr:cytochrome P450 [Beijerinckia sp. L45]